MRVRYGYPTNGISPILVIIVANLFIYVLIFILGKISLPLTEKIFLSLALPMPEYFWAQPWTIVTSMFLHTRFWHIFANMITLYFFGTAFNRLVGEKRFLLVYFSGGIIGNIFLLLLAGFAPYSVALGASGAVFALAGGLVMMRPKLPVIIFPIPIPVPLWVAVMGGFLLLSFMPSVAWQAHLGGLIVGLIAGYISRRRERYSFF
jgi:membrane associated rhomboid family serine protease